MTKTRFTNIVVQGLLKVRKDRGITDLFLLGKINILGNTIRFKQVESGKYWNFTLYIKQYFEILTIKNKLNRCIKYLIKKKRKQCKIKVVGLRIINVHEKLVINHDTETLKNQFLRKLCDEFNITSLLVAPQEDNSSCAPVRADSFITAQHFTYNSASGQIPITKNKKLTFKIQLDKFKIIAHCTFLYSAFNKKTKKILNFFEQESVNCVY